MRPLARVQAEALRRRGAEVLLVTTGQHPEPDTARDYELVLDPRFGTASTWPESLSTWRRIRQFRPEIVIADLVRDPRWIALAGKAPRIQLVQGERSDHPAEQRPVWERALLARWGARSAATLTRSNYDATAVATRRDVRGTPVHVMPLTSDLDAALVPPLADADERHDFVMVGQLNPGSNIDVVLQSWERHVSGGCWRGDELVLIGDGPLVIRSLPAFVRWQPGKYRHSDIVTPLAHAKGSVVHHRHASAIDIQLLSMQLGVMPIVSPVGGLPEYQPPNYPPIGVDDITALAAAFDDLAEPLTATIRGAAAARHYQDRFAADCVADRLLNLIGEVLATRRRLGSDIHGDR